jgi:hypothetical protein
LVELNVLNVLPDETDPQWLEEGSPLWGRMGEFLAFADEVASRELTVGVRPLLDRACFGDPFETMRGLRHRLERAVGGRWHVLTEICVEATGSPRPGTRLWAINQLAILRDPAAIDCLGAALDDDEPRVREEACMAVEMLAQRHREVAAPLLERLSSLATTDPDISVRHQAHDAVEHYIQAP